MLTSLNLSYSAFSGQIPSELSHLSKLSSLDLSTNFDLYTQSDLGSLVQNLTSLDQLLLSEVNISSDVPESLANLSSLTTLDLGYCQLHGEFPTRIFQLPNLRDLRIGGNQNLTGHLPEFHSTSSLEVLKLEGTSFSGKLPTSIGNLSSLHVLDVVDCHFSGSIPPSLSNLSQLTQLFLSHNKLSGMLEFDMFLKIKTLSILMLSSNNFTLLTKANSNDTLPQFESLGLGYCNLEKFPDFIRNQNKLIYLDLAGNNLQGLIPKWFYNTSVETLGDILLSDNFLTGFEQSQAVLPWSTISSLELQRNQLQGSLPIPQPSIRFYQVQMNWIREISPLICNLSSLYELDLSYNNLSGKLYPCLGNSSSLYSLKLQRNNFHGTIPKTWAMGSNLRLIDLSENQFQGQLPRSMTNCMMLEYLHVGNNQINDTFPFWLGTLSRLKVLIIRSNAFHGAIKSPQMNYTFPELHIIDLSHNGFSGNLPTQYFLHLIAMKEVG
jgi:Leucine-rich repeat (LRR) protein